MTDEKKPAAQERGGQIDKDQVTRTSPYKEKSQHGLGVEDALAAIELAKAAHPQLCRYGMVWEPSQQCDEDFSLEGIVTAITYLQRFPKHHTPRWSSYFLKHRAENFGCRENLSCYVANGEMICACVFLGLPLSWSGRSPNVAVGIKLPRDYVRRAMDGAVD